MAGGGAQHALVGPGDGGGDGGVGGDFEGVAVEEDVPVGFESAVAGGKTGDEGGKLGGDGLPVFAGDGSPFDFDPAVIGVGAEFAAAFDEGGVDGGRAEQGVDAGGEVFAQAFEGDEEFAGFDDGVDAEFGFAAVGGDAVDVDGGPGEAFVGDAEAQGGGLADDGGVGGVFAEEGFGADAGVFFVGDAGEDDVAPQFEAGGGDGPHGGDGGGEAAFHVEAASPVYAAVLVDGVEGGDGHFVEADGVGVAVEDDAAAAAAAFADADDVEAAGGDFPGVDFEAAGLEVGAEVAGDGLFPPAAGYERGVDGVDADEGLQVGEQFAAVDGDGFHWADLQSYAGDGSRPSQTMRR